MNWPEYSSLNYHYGISQLVKDSAVFHRNLLYLDGMMPPYSGVLLVYLFRNYKNINFFKKMSVEKITVG